MYRTFAMIALMVTFLSACGGGGGGDDRSSAPAAIYGTLTLSGSGSSIAGAQFKAMESQYGTAMWSIFSWSSDDGKVLTVQASGNYISGVELSYFASDAKPYKWHSTGENDSIAGVTIGASSVVFSGAKIRGYLNTTSSLTLNGTLTY